MQTPLARSLFYLWEELIMNNPMLQKLRLSQKRYITKDIVSVHMMEANQGCLTNARRPNEEQNIPIMVLIVEEFLFALVRMWVDGLRKLSVDVSHS